MTVWAAPDPRQGLAVVAPTTYSWGWSATCACQAEWSTHPTAAAARDASHLFAVRCPMARRRLTHHRHPREVA